MSKINDLITHTALLERELDLPDPKILEKASDFKFDKKVKNDESKVAKASNVEGKAAHVTTESSSGDDLSREEAELIAEYEQLEINRLEIRK